MLAIYNVTYIFFGRQALIRKKPHSTLEKEVTCKNLIIFNVLEAVTFMLSRAVICGRMPGLSGRWLIVGLNINFATLGAFFGHVFAS